VRFMAVDNYKTWAYCAYYPSMVHLGSIWDIQVISVDASWEVM